MDNLAELIAKTHAVKDRKGEYHINCPECGHPSSPSSPHCSFGAKGWHCFVCGEGGGLADLAKRLDLAPVAWTAPAPEPKQPAAWLATAEGLIQRCHTPAAWDAWQTYKPVSRADFERCRLGLGVLPYSACHHPRLIVPIIDGTMIVGLRGRRLDCSCPAKWLAPKDTDISLYPLYNQDSLGQGQIVFVVENPIDALLLAEPDVVGVATCSTTYWHERWEQALVAARPCAIVVAFDNDLPGNGGDLRRAEFIRDWRSKHPESTGIPQSSGIRLANRLSSLRLPVRLYPWGRAAHKADIGSLLVGAA